MNHVVGLPQPLAVRAERRHSVSAPIRKRHGQQKGREVVGSLICFQTAGRKRCHSFFRHFRLVLLERRTELTIFSREERVDPQALAKEKRKGKRKNVASSSDGEP